MSVEVDTAGPAPAAPIRVTALDGTTEVASAAGAPGTPLTLRIPNAHRWSPADPFLYGLRIEVPGGDSVRSYFGMRSIAVARDARGFNRLFLNGQPLFELGLLDQGWWPDGLYTAPTDAALASDIETTKRLGFNLIRKHVKVEPARWYYHADRLGVLVWQDMPSGKNDTPESQAEFAQELEHVVDAVRNHPAIVMWVPFNEGWGQHDTPRYVAWLKQHDPTRLVDDASGWTDQGRGRRHRRALVPRPRQAAARGRVAPRSSASSAAWACHSRATPGSPRATGATAPSRRSPSSATRGTG